MKCTETKRATRHQVVELAHKLFPCCDRLEKVHLLDKIDMRVALVRFALLKVLKLSSPVRLLQFCSLADEGNDHRDLIREISDGDDREREEEDCSVDEHRS